LVTPRVDYCNSVLEPKSITDQLQRVPNAAARFISNTGKYECRLSQLLHDDLHWLEVPQRVQYKLAVTVHRCLWNWVPAYLADHSVPVSKVAGHRHLWSAARHQLTVPRVHHSTFGTLVPLILLVPQLGIHCLTICVIHLRDHSSFGIIWKRICLVSALCRQRIRGVFHVSALYKCSLTYLRWQVTEKIKRCNSYVSQVERLHSDKSDQFLCFCNST